nr:hypothetical protein [Tanacetum cinerariifolium]
MTAILKQFQATSPPASVKSVEEICVTCGGAHLYYYCLAADGKLSRNLVIISKDTLQQPQLITIRKDILRACPHHSFTELHQLDTFYNALNPADQDSLNAAAGGNLLERRTQDVLTIIENKSKVRNSRSKSVVSQVKACDVNSNSSSEIAKLTHAVNQQTSVVTTAMTAILKQFQATPPPASDKAVEETYVTCGGAHPYYHCLAAGGNTFSELRDNIQGYVSAAAVNYNQGNPGFCPPGSGSLPSNTVANPRVNSKPSPLVVDLLLMDLPFPLLPNPLIRRDPGKFLIPCSFGELKCKALADLGASINLMPLSVWKKLGLPELISTRITFELANRAVCTPSGIARDVFVSVGKFTFPADFVIVDYESDPRVPLILGRPFLQTAHALIDILGEEMILCDGDERLILNMRHDTSSYSNQLQRESINLINVFNNSSEDFLENFFSNQPSGNPTFSSHLELTSPKVNNDNPLSGSTTFSSNPLLEEFADELVFPSKYDDDLQFDIESDLKEIEFMLHQDIDYCLKDSIDLANPADKVIDSVPEMFTDEYALDFSSPLIFDEYDDDFLEVEFDAENIYDDPFDSKGEKIKESKLLIDELDLLCGFLPSEYDSFISQDFSKVDAFPSTNNEDKIFNPGILIQEKYFKIITRVVQDKKLASSNASLVLEDFDPHFHEPLFFKEVSSSKMLLPFSFENEEKVFKPGYSRKFEDQYRRILSPSLHFLNFN